MNALRKINDHELLKNFDLLVSREREATASVVAHLAEIDRRKLYAREGYSSLFSYCVEKYHYGEGASYRRIQTARLSQRFSEIISFLEKGDVTLTTMTLISPYLNQENKGRLFQQVKKKSKKEVEKILASLFPKGDDIEDKIRKLPIKKAVMDLDKAETSFKSVQNGTHAGVSSSEASKGMPINHIDMAVSACSAIKLEQRKQVDIIKPVTVRRVKIEFSADEALAKYIDRAKEILRHKYPQAKLEDIFREALETLLEKRDPERKAARMEKRKENQKVGQTVKENILKNSHSEHEASGEARRISKRSFGRSLSPRKRGSLRMTTRYISQDVRRKVWSRDGGQCVYQSPDGKKCGERAALELDHAQPFALGGKSTAENLQLLCRAHNQYRAQQTFGVFRC